MYGLSRESNYWMNALGTSEFDNQFAILPCIQNSTHRVALLLPRFEEMNLGLAQLALKTHAFSSCVNVVLQLGFSKVHRSLGKALYIVYV